MPILYSHLRRGVLLAASAAAVMLAAPSVSAQDYYDETAYDRTPVTEEVIVQAPEYYRHQQRDSATGAPIVDVAMSREVRFDDLDLRSGWGARALRTRVSATARRLCDRLNVRFPATTADSPDCFRTAYYDAMAQADEAIARARGY
jgi:UrcA family protein